MGKRGLLGVAVLIGLTSCGSDEPVSERTFEPRTAESDCQELRTRLETDDAADVYDFYFTVSKETLIEMRDVCPDEVARGDQVSDQVKKERRKEAREAAQSEAATSAPDPVPVDEYDEEVEDVGYPGLSESEVTALGVVADQYGYGLGPGTSLSYDQALDFALGVTYVCEDVAAGTGTWEDHVADDIASGAPPGDAEGFNGYLRDVFCPSIG